MVIVDEAILEIVAQLVDAWNKRDMKAFASLFTLDAHYITGQGRWLKGREAIEQEFSKSHSAAEQFGLIIITGTFIKQLNPDVALVHNTWELADPTGEEEEGSRFRRGIITQVLIRQGERWLIAALQNTDAAERLTTEDTEEHGG